MSKSQFEQLDLWSHEAWSHPKVKWQGNYLDNGFCADCRFCCGPQIGDDPYPMPLLPTQIKAGAAQHLYLLDQETACLDERGCKALGQRGCTLSRELRPISCGLFPLVPCQGRLYLYWFCPAVLNLPLKVWWQEAKSALTYLESLTLSERRRLNLSLPKEKVAERLLPLPLFLNLDAD
ncbi:MAG: hypothetical protein IJS50_05655 [Desulfovibrio sp.]|nr:hypothetical protein [Desulfovibrio sp.]